MSDKSLFKGILYLSFLQPFGCLNVDGFANITPQHHLNHNTVRAICNMNISHNSYVMLVPHTLQRQDRHYVTDMRTI